MADVNDLKDHFRLNCRLALDLAMQQVRDDTRADAPVGTTGSLAAGIDYEPVQDEDTRMTTALGSEDIRLQWMDEGTPPHEITPRGPGYPLVFHWPIAGGRVAFMRVQHPGTKALHFFRQPLPDRLNRALTEALGAFE